MVTSIYIGKKKTGVEGRAGRGRVKACGAPWPGVMVRRHQELGWLETPLGLFFFFSWPGCSWKGDESPDYLTISQTTWGLRGGDVSASA